MRLALILVISALPVAAATDFPRFDVDAECLATHGSNNLARSQCIRMEQSGYDIAKSFFTDLDQADRDRCVKSATDARSYRYTYLYQCARNARQMQEIRRRQSDPPPRFRP